MANTREIRKSLKAHRLSPINEQYPSPLVQLREELQRAEETNKRLDRWNQSFVAANLKTTEKNIILAREKAQLEQKLAENELLIEQQTRAVERMQIAVDSYKKKYEQTKHQLRRKEKEVKTLSLQNSRLRQLFSIFSSIHSGAQQHQGQPLQRARPLTVPHKS